MAERRILGLDIGGAHLKAAWLEQGSCRQVRQLPCPLWQGIGHLEQALAAVLAAGPRPDALAVTMTGELADIFADRALGVAAILALARRLAGDVPLWVWSMDADFIDAEAARARWAEVASANWHATLSWTARRLPAALLVDIGSTTTDILPLAGGRARSRARTDRERLAEGELVYAGLTRTALMALAAAVPFQGRQVPVMRELFATTADAWRLLGRLDESADQHPAADGGAKTVAGSAQRLARMIGADRGEADDETWRRLAGVFARAELRLIEDGLALVLSRGELPAEAPLVGLGVGGFLVADLAPALERQAMLLAELIPAVDAAVAAQAAAAAPAFAVAALLDAGG